MKYSAGSRPISVATGDFNKDIQLDIVVVNQRNDTVSVLLGYGNGSFEKPLQYSTGSIPRSVAVGDFNNDSYLDIVIANFGDDTISILLGYGDGAFANQMTYSTVAWPYYVTVADFNKDNHLDVVVVNTASNSVSVFLGYGDGSFANQATYSTGSGASAVAVDDLNNDNRLDIVVTNWNDNTMSVFLGYDNGVFADQITYPTGHSPVLNTTPITKFEQLPNELILMCFCYFSYYHVYQMFYRLNQRFNQLIQYETKIHLELYSIPSGKFLTFCIDLNQIITTSQNYPLSIVAHDKYRFNLIFYDDLFKDKLSKVKSLTLSNIDARTIYSIIFDETIKLYQSLERLSLQNKIGEENNYTDNIKRNNTNS
ncbi:unnamed protein product [Rotaria sp. Silwood1]|nr:unnamed protein product [Rotaria sp. Silwood1]